MASTETMTHRDTLDSQYISSSLSNLSRSRSTNSLIVRTYKQATQLYLTKRFKEALETLEPIITARQSQPDGATNRDAEGSGARGAAPVAQSSKGTRTKVWVFYLSLVHAIIELGPEEGKREFGSARWRELANKAREGTVWDEVARAGYGGQEGDVDADVVVNLATLLMGHMQHQRLNQQKLETWLATSSGPDGGQQLAFADGTMSPAPNGAASSPNGAASSPKALATRLKILELYTLHVLPANEEWGYAREFIDMNDALDDERREAFLHALQELREEKDGTAMRERELAERREREMEHQRVEEEKRRAEQARQEEERRMAADAERQRPTSRGSDAAATSSKAAANGTAKPTPTAKPPTTRPSASNKAAKKPPPSPPPTFYRRASTALNNLPHMILQASRSMTGSSMAMFRLLMFMVAFLVLVARRDLRLKLKRTLEDGWMKVRRTVGMGVKVSYI